MLRPYTRLLILAVLASPLRAQTVPTGLQAMAGDPAVAAASFDHGALQTTTFADAGSAPSQAAPAPAVEKAPHPIVAASVPASDQKAASSSDDKAWIILLGLAIGVVGGGVAGYFVIGGLEGALFGGWFCGLLGAAIGLGIAKS